MRIRVFIADELQGEVEVEKMHSYIKLYRDYYRLEGGRYIKIPMPKKIKSEFFKPN